MSKCSIIIPVHNHASLTRQCLNTLLADPQLGGNIEIIVVDDASSDTTEPLLTNYRDKIRILTHTENLGFATACNDGAAISSGEHLVFLNNDTIPESGWLEALVDYADGRPKVGVVGSKLLFPNSTIQHSGMVICQDLYPRHLYNGFPADHPAVNKSRRFQIVTAACSLVRREAFEKVGGFDTAFTNGYEDVDLCLRLGEKGYEIHYCHESVLWHLEAASRDPRGDQEKHNSRLYFSRWAHRVQPDELHYYLEDNLIRITHRELYPLQIEISPLLAVTGGDESERVADRLLNARSRQVFELLKENIELKMLMQEASPFGG
jgi:GT2 family glycosyltransferase